MQTAEIEAKNIDSDAMLDCLAASSVFQGLGQAALRPFARDCVFRRFVALEEAVAEGETHSALNVVVTGRFVVLLPSNRLHRFGENAMVSLACYQVGDCFGEESLVKETPLAAIASVVAAEPSQVLAISRRNFEIAIVADSHVAQQVYRNLFVIQTRRLNALRG